MHIIASCNNFIKNKSKNAKDLKIWVTDNSIALKKYYLPIELDLADFPTFVEKRTELLTTVLTDILTL